MFSEQQHRPQVASWRTVHGGTSGKNKQAPRHVQAAPPLPLRVADHSVGLNSDLPTCVQPAAAGWTGAADGRISTPQPQCINQQWREGKKEFMNEGRQEGSGHTGSC